MKLGEEIDTYLDRYRRYTNGRLVHDETTLDYEVEQILQKQQMFKEIMRTKKSALLKKNLKENAKNRLADEVLY